MAYTAVQVSRGEGGTGGRPGPPVGGATWPGEPSAPMLAAWERWPHSGPGLPRGGFAPSLTRALPLPAALRPPVQNSSETAREGQDAVTGPSPAPRAPACRHSPLLRAGGQGSAPGSGRNPELELFCVALEDLGDSFSVLSFELPRRSVWWRSPGARPQTWGRVCRGAPSPRGGPAALRARPLWTTEETCPAPPQRPSSGPRPTDRQTDRWTAARGARGLLRPPHRPDHSLLTQMLPLWSEEGQHWPLGPQVLTPPCVPHPGPGCGEPPQGAALECVSLEPPWTLVP